MWVYPICVLLVIVVQPVRDKSAAQSGQVKTGLHHYVLQAGQWVGTVKM